ncbi:MAG: antitoxin [Limisphaerales bacterium]
MRTTVTIDADTEALLKEEAARTGQSFKVVLNQAVQRALGRPSPDAEVEVEPLFKAAFPHELAQQSFNRLASEWDDEDTVRELSS